MTAFPLLRALLAADLDEVEAMDLLQDSGVISDNCVNLSEIAEADLGRAIEFIGAIK